MVFIKILLNSNVNMMNVEEVLEQDIDYTFMSYLIKG